ncbi:MAG TPA: FAD:protein FMN transferase [Kofleriaceae bacterium]|nr:FAD:protein FMN transferase [Kofleriaceae bacterium]
MWTFRAMNTDITISAPALGDADERLLARDVARLFADTEQRFSRFREDSELSVLNRATEPIVVSPELLELLLAARVHAAESAGLFDPAVGAALAAAGYDRSFAPGVLDRAASEPPPAHADLSIDEPRRRVTRPAGTLLDFGGFLKGRTVDRAAALTTGPVAIDAGGDAMLRGARWLVDVEDPRDARATLVTVVVRDRAVATSAPNRRRWRVGSSIAHHLIDPRTRQPSRSDLAQVTVLAPTAERADVMAKVVFLLGATDGAALVARHDDLGAVLVTTSGELSLVGDVEVAHA